MARIAGVDLPRERPVQVALTAIYGIGRSAALHVLAKTGVPIGTRVKDLDEPQVLKIRDAIETMYQVEGDLRRQIAGNIKRLIDIGCYRGLRHRRGLPLRGQRTKTNARTRKGPRKAIGRAKKPMRK